MNDSIRAEALSLNEAASKFEISPQTLRRLCDSGQLPCERDSKGWRVREKDVEGYLLSRRPAGRQSVALWLQGPAPNPRLRDGVGWLFKAVGRGGQQIPIQVWFSNELVAILQRDNYEVRDIVVKAAEHLVADALLESDELTPGQEILYGSADRWFILRSAGFGDESYLAGEAPHESGVCVVYEFSPRDFARDGVWPGDSLDVGDTAFVDVVVDSRADATSRRVRTVRMSSESLPSTRSAAIQAALRAYESRCQRLGRTLGAWVLQVAARSNALTLAQQRVLELIYECWRREGDWPVPSFIENKMDRDYDLVLGDILATFPPGLIYGLSPNRIQLDRLQLTFAGLLHCENAAADVDLFTATVGYLARRQREFVPASATHVETLAVTSDEVRRDVPSAASSPPRAVERLYDLIMQDPYAFNGGGKNAEGSWTVTVGPEIRRYRGIQTVEDYLSRRQPVAAASDLPRMSMPLKVQSIADLSLPMPDAMPETPTSITLAVGASPEADVFVLMPFAMEFRDVWTAIEQTSAELGVSCVRADRITVPGRISQQIVEAIRAASVIVADVTGNNPNVMFELGYADALGKPIVVLNQRLAEAPFDLKDWRQIEYTTAALRDLKVTLASFLDQTLVKPRQSATDQGLAASLEISHGDEAPFRVDDGRSVMHRFGIRNPGLTAARNVRVELIALDPKPSDPSFRADFPYAVARSDSPDNLAPDVTINPGDEIRFNVGESHVGGQNQAEIYMDNMTRTPEEVARHWPNHTRFDRGGRWRLRYRVTAANASPKEFALEVSERGDKLWCRVVDA